VPFRESAQFAARNHAHSVEAGVAPRRPERSGGAVDPQSRCVRPLDQQGDEDATRSGPEIGDAERLAGSREELERRCHDRLGIGSRHQGVGGENEGQSPELPLPQDAGHRFVGQAPGGQGREGLALSRLDRLVRPRDQSGGVDGEGVAQEKAGVQRRRLDPRSRKGPAQPSQHLRAGAMVVEDGHRRFRARPASHSE
jgi:hypothetical protein